MSLVVNNLTKKFAKFTAVDNLSFEVEKGSFFALLGENGAGKSTTISCMTLLTNPTSGDILIDGEKVSYNSNKVKAKIGTVFQESLLDNLLSCRDNLRIRANLYGSISAKEVNSRIKDLSNDLELHDFIDKRYATLSGGQRRRCDIARALIHKPSIVFLDEPTSGLDPHARELVWESIKKLKEKYNLTIVLTTHYLDEVKDADKVVVLDKGKKLVQGSAEEIRLKYTSKHGSFYAVSSDALAKIIETITPFITTHEVDNLNIKCSFKPGVSIPSVLASISSFINDLEIVNGSMDEAFINLTK